MPIQMRLPKIGFKNPNRVAYIPINLDRIQMISEKFNLNTVDLEALAASGIIRKKDKVKILGTGELKAKLSVQAHAFSATAKEAIEQLGGTVSIAE